jgi:hypothetical protein
MKKRMIAALCALVLTLSLCACGSSSAASTPAASAEQFNGAMGFTQDATAEMQDSSTYTADAGDSGQSAAPQGETKLIYTAELDMETTDFDTAAAGLETLVETLGGYMEYSSVSNGGDGYRYASYTVRIPAEKFRTFLKQAGELCQITYQSSGAEDVSEYYYDTAGRLETQKTKLERLQSLLSKADKMEDIISLESAISETEEQIESLSGELSHYDAQVDYATVTVSMNEVYRLSGTTEPANGFSQRVGSALSSGWNAFVSFLQNIVVALAYGWMWLLLAAVVVAFVLWRTRNSRRERKAAKAAAAAKASDDAAARIAAIRKVQADAAPADEGRGSDADKPEQK